MRLSKVQSSIVFSALFGCFALAGELDKWDTADLETVRLSPDKFMKLPIGVRNDLSARGCTIPQLFCCKEELHNVISGHFKDSTQLDWAILCSIERHSTLLVYWGDTSMAVSELDTTGDIHWLQGTGDDKLGFSHVISTVGTNYVRDHANSYGTVIPAALGHEGIDDGFMGKASMIRYWYQGKWLSLQGAD